MWFITQLLLLLGLRALLAEAVPVPQANGPVSAVSTAASGYWVGSIQRRGAVAFGNNTSYQVFRNVKDFGAKGDGVTDDTAAINQAISSGNRCGNGCDSSTVTPALVYFPSGTYLVSKPIVQYYYTQFVGDAINVPVLKAAAGFQGMAVIDADPYNKDGSNWYTNQNNFFRAVRNFVIDLTAMPQSAGAGIHWQVGQATSLQNIRFEMVQGGGDANKQQGIFMDNGSGGFMSDLVFNGGNYGMFVGNQQFTTRNLTFNNCNTAIFMNWNWAWTFKSVQVNNCGVGLNMSNSPSNQTVGSVLVLDSTFSTTTAGIVSAFTTDSIPVGGGVLVLENVDFTGSPIAVAGVSGNTVVSGGTKVANWVQGNVYSPSALTANPVQTLTRREIVEVIEYEVVEACPAPNAGSNPAESARVVQPLSGTSSSQTAPPPEIPVTITAGGVVATLSLPVGETGVDTLTLAPSSTSASAASQSSPSGEQGQSAVTAPAPLPVGTPPPSVSISIGLSVPAVSPAPSVPASATVSTQPTSSVTAATASSAAPGSGSGTCANTGLLSKIRLQATMPAQAKPSSLLDGSGKVLERSKPLYETYPASSFVSVKSFGAKGDGSTDDTAAIQKAMNTVTTDQILYFDHGAYVITSTVKVPKNIKMTGEIWPLLMARGSAFADEKNPVPMLQIGQPGDTGSVEMSDLVLETMGPAPGAILMEWNVAEASPGSVGMWDVHFRLGGSAGTQMQSNTCPKTPNTTTTPNPQCMAAFLSLHITEQASAYIENSWAWTADHELDLGDHSQIDIYAGRGVLIESHGPVWLYGTASEHHQLYNYQVSNAQNVWMGLIQTETPYYQSNPDSLVPFTPQASWHDPDFATCTTESCKKSWGLRVLNSSDLWVYGAGLYSFFDNYDQTCLATESCQENMVEVDCSQVHIFGLSTKASKNMVTSSGGTGLVAQLDNISNFCSTIALFEQS